MLHIKIGSENSRKKTMSVQIFYLSIDYKTPQVLKEVNVKFSVDYIKVVVSSLGSVSLFHQNGFAAK